MFAAGAETRSVRSNTAGSKMAITTRSNNVDNKQPGVCLAKGLARAPETTGQGRDTEKQQCRTDNRPGDLRLDDANLRLPQDKEREHQLRDIAEN